jgi:hypothetical protein
MVPRGGIEPPTRGFSVLILCYVLTLTQTYRDTITIIYSIKTVVYI